MVKLGRVAFDGTKVKANAGKHKAMSYERMAERETELEAQVAAILAEAEAVDSAEDALYGNARGDELPAELRTRESQLQRIREAKAALEVDARERTGDQPLLRIRPAGVGYGPGDPGGWAWVWSVLAAQRRH
jgi:hypothetical protein